MIFFFILFIHISSIVQYSVVANVLKISGTGEITVDGAKSKGSYLDIIEVQIEEGPTKIQNSAFQEFIKLVKINIPKSVTSIEAQPFFRCKSLKQIIVDEGNENYCSIDNHLYTKNKEQLIFASLNPITFPDNLKTIGTRAFSAGSSFSYESLIFPDSLTSFTGCSFNEVDIRFIDWNNSPQISEIPTSCFMYTTFGTLTIPKSCKIIQTKAFLSASIEKLIFQEESSLETLSSYAFQEMFTLKTIVFPDSLKTVNDFAFYQVSSLTSITFGLNVNNISKSAFTGCSNLEEIIIPQGNQFYISTSDSILTKDETEIIYIKQGIESYSLNSKVEKFGQTLFQSQKNLVEITTTEGNTHFYAESGVIYSADNLTLICVCGGIERVEVKDSVISLENSCCYGLTKLKEFIFLGESCTTIGDSAFYESSLTSLNLPNSIQQIGGHAFRLSSLTELTINAESNLTKIEERCFKNSKLISFFIPKSLTIIEEYAFEGSELTNLTFDQECQIKSFSIFTFTGCKIKFLTLPYSLEETGSSSFERCSQLEIVKYTGSTLHTISADTFNGCINLKSAEFPNFSGIIETSAFYSCSSLIHISGDAKEIKTTAFGNCYSLQSFNFSISISSVDAGIFKGCRSLTKFTIAIGNPTFKTKDDILFDISEKTLTLFPPGLERVAITPTTERFASNAFAFSEKLKFVYFYSGSPMKEFNESTFIDCISLKSVQFPSQLQKICSSCFSGCVSLTSLSFPSSLETIESNAFSGCSSITKIKYCGTYNLTTNDAFDNEMKNKIRIFVTDLYSESSFCSINIYQKLNPDCEIKPIYITCENNCFKYSLLLPFTSIFIFY